MDDEVVTVRLPRKDAEAVDRLVKDGSFLNRSDFVRDAVRAALEERDEGGIGRLGLDVGAGQARPQTRRNARGVRR